MEIRLNCYIDQLILDFLTFCEHFCSIDKLMARFGHNMTKLGHLYMEFLNILIDKFPANIRDETVKIHKMGYKLGNITRLALAFDLFD